MKEKKEKKVKFDELYGSSDDEEEDKNDEMNDIHKEILSQYRSKKENQEIANLSDKQLELQIEELQISDTIKQEIESMRA